MGRFCREGMDPELGGDRKFNGGDGVDPRLSEPGVSAATDVSLLDALSSDCVSICDDAFWVRAVLALLLYRDTFRLGLDGCGGELGKCDDMGDAPSLCGVDATSFIREWLVSSAMI